VANWLIDRNIDDPSDLTHLKLQKLLYFFQGWHLVYFDFPLFEDNIHAWKYGPVVESVYYELRGYGKDDIIKNPIHGYTFEDGEYKVDIPIFIPLLKGEDGFLASAWSQLAKQETWRLVSASHAEGGPWDQVVNKVKSSGHRMNPIIPIGLMKSYFKSLASGD
jgi:uncharacterized phage-associated protein